MIVGAKYAEGSGPASVQLAPLHCSGVNGGRTEVVHRSVQPEVHEARGQYFPWI